MQRRQSPAVSVFYTGVSLSVDRDRLRQHFETVGHVTGFRMFGPAPGKDFRYGIVDYMDSQTADDAIRRLNGTTFGERPMRVTAARNTMRGPPPPGIRKRRRDLGPGHHHHHHNQQQQHSVRNHNSPHHHHHASHQHGQPYQQRRPPVAEKPLRDTMSFPRFFSDPILGREESLVLDALRGMSTEKAYEAVEQLRIMALERKESARMLLQDNPALKSAIVMILQHAGRLPHGALPVEAYRTSAESIRTSVAATEEEEEGGTAVSPLADGDVTAEVEAEESLTAGITEEERDEVLELIQNMSEEDVERVLTMTAADLEQVPDPFQRKQLEVLQIRLLEMSNNL